MSKLKNVFEDSFIVLGASAFCFILVSAETKRTSELESLGLTQNVLTVKEESNLSQIEPFKDTVYVVSEKGVVVKEVEKPKAILVSNVVEHPIKTTEEPVIKVSEKTKKGILYNTYFGSEESVESFVRYVKTQSNDLTSKAGWIDNYYVIQVMLNRLRKNNCTWQEYFTNNKINCSATIKKIKAGKKVPNNSKTGNYDEIRGRLFEVINGELPDSLLVPENLYYFHSHKRKFARGIWSQKEYYCSHKHHFFTGK